MDLNLTLNKLIITILHKNIIYISYFNTILFYTWIVQKKCNAVFVKIKLKAICACATNLYDKNLINVKIYNI